MQKLFKILGLCVLVLMVCAAIAGILITQRLSAANLQTYLSQNLGREVTIGDVHIGWRSPLHLEIRDLCLANAAWGSQPDMLRLGSVSADIALRPLLKGVIEYQNLAVEDFNILLERDKNGVGNWRLDGKLPDKNAPVPNGGLTLVPKNRTQFPNLLNFTLHHGQLLLRVSSGKFLRLNADTMKINAANGNAPMQMMLNGAYNGTSASMIIDGGSFTQLRNRTAPYAMNVHIKTPDSELDFGGTSMNPLDMDGLDGNLHIATANFGNLLRVLDMASPANLKFKIAGHLGRHEDDWQLSKLESNLAGNFFTGQMGLREGARGQADAIMMNLSTRHMDAKKIYNGFGTGGFVQSNSFTDKSGSSFDVGLRAGDLQYGLFHAYDIQSHLVLRPGDMQLNIPTVKLLGGKAVVIGSIKATDDTHLNYRLQTDLLQANLSQLLQTLAVKTTDISGPFDFHGNLAMMGKNWREALRAAHGQAVFTMKTGFIAQDILEKMSLDVRNLMRNNDKYIPLNCLTARVTLRNSVGEISPLVLDTQNADFTGYGTIDVTRRYLDLKLQSDPKSTSIFALDVPLHLSGNLSDLNISPAFGAKLPPVKLVNCMP